MSNVEFATLEEVRKVAEVEYERDHPRPTPPDPVGVGRPAVIHIGDNGHLWIDIVGVNDYTTAYRNASVSAKLFLIQRDHEKDQRIEGCITPENIDGLIQELNRVRTELVAKQAFVAANSAYEKQVAEWDRTKAEFARRQVANWEKSQKKKE